MKKFLLKDTTGRGISAIKLGVESILDFVSDSDDDVREEVEAYLENASISDALHLEDERVLITRIEDE